MTHDRSKTPVRGSGVGRTEPPQPPAHAALMAPHEEDLTMPAIARGSAGLGARLEIPHASHITPAHEPPTHPRVRARGTPRDGIAPGEQIRTLIFASEPIRAAWIEGELSRAPISITIQVARRVRTVVSALVRDPPPRPKVLIVDFDAVAPGELLELHAIRHEGWCGRLIGLGAVPEELAASLGVDHVFAVPFVRDSLLDCVAGTRHAAVTTVIPLIPLRDDDR